MTVKFYYAIISQPSRSVLLFIRANKLDVEEKTVSLMKGEHKTEEFKQVSPFQKLPVIDHDGFRLTESVAIMQYLSNVFKTADHWYPKASKARAKVDEYLSWHHTNLRKTAIAWVRTIVMQPLMTKQPVDDALKIQLTRDYNTTLDEFERYFLANNATFIGGANDISIADLLASQEIDTNAGTGHDTFSMRPGLAAYMERVRTKLQPHYGVLVEQMRATMVAASESQK